MVQCNLLIDNPLKVSLSNHVQSITVIYDTESVPSFQEADHANAETDLATAESDNVRLFEQNNKLKEELSILITRFEL